MTAVLRLGRSLLKFRITCGTVVRHVGGSLQLDSHAYTEG